MPHEFSVWHEVLHQDGNNFPRTVTLDLGAPMRWVAQSTLSTVCFGDDDVVLDIAVKASSTARDARDRLRVVGLQCPPTAGLSRHRVEFESGGLVLLEAAELQLSETSLTCRASGRTAS